MTKLSVNSNLGSMAQEQAKAMQSVVQPFTKRSLSFDGVDDEATFDIESIFSKIGNSDFTISYWVYADTFTDTSSSYVNYGLASHQVFTSNPTVYNMCWIGNLGGSTNSGKMGFYIWNGVIGPMTWMTTNRVDQDNHLIDGKWNHVLFSCDKGASARTLSLYINGNLVESKSAGGVSSFTTAHSAAKMVAGKDQYGLLNTSYFEYKLDSINFFTTTMSASEVEDIFNYGVPKDESSRTGHVADYRFGGNTANKIKGASAIKKIEKGTATLSKSTPNKVIRTCLDFDGTNDRLGWSDTDFIPTLVGDKNFTMTWWIKSDDYVPTGSTNRYIGPAALSIVGANLTQFSIHVTAPSNSDSSARNKVRWSVLSPGNKYVVHLRSTADASTFLTDGEWHHIAITSSIDSATSRTNKLYVDGTLIASTDDKTASAPSDFSANPDPCVFGANGVNNNGTISYSTYQDVRYDDLMIMNKALEASDIAKIYNLGAQTDKLISGRIGTWRFDADTKDQSQANHATATGATFNIDQPS